jgi:hypothetical protein
VIKRGRKRLNLQKEVDVTVTSRTEALARYVKLAKEKKKEKAEDKSEAVMDGPFMPTSTRSDGPILHFQKILFS